MEAGRVRMAIISATYLQCEDGRLFSQGDSVPFFRALSERQGSGASGGRRLRDGTNVWRKYPNRPPKAAQAKMLYFHAGGKLSFDAPTEVSSR